jgi:hypothetical protein
MRAGNYVTIIQEVSRLLACYNNGFATPEPRQLYRDLFARNTGVLCILDDIRDTRAFDIQIHVPNSRLGLAEYMPYLTADMAGEFIAPEPHHTFLLASLDLARSQNSCSNLRDNDKAEVIMTLRDCFWPKEQGSVRTYKLGI